MEERGLLVGGEGGLRGGRGRGGRQPVQGGGLGAAASQAPDDQCQDDHYRDQDQGDDARNHVHHALVEGRLEGYTVLHVQVEEIWCRHKSGGHTKRSVNIIYS